jgi:pimeloyl-ACP methyl ester carboxylesterase
MIKRTALLLVLLCLLTKTYCQTISPSVAKHFTSHDKTRIYFEVHGQGLPVILVHGFANNSESWKKKPIFNELIKNNFQVILIDLRGNGRSDKPHTEAAYLNDAEAKDIMALVDTLGLKSYSAVGYSRGSIIASRLLVLDKRIDRAVLGGMGDDFTNPQWPRRILFYEVLAAKRIVPELDGFLNYIRDSGQDREALALMQLGQPATSKEELAKIKNRVLVVCGSEDRDNGSPENLSKLLPASEYRAIPGNHNNASQNKEFSDAVVDFLLNP